MAREQAAQAMAAREKAERDKQARQERKTRREAEAARHQEIRESTRGHRPDRLATEVNRISDIKDLAQLLERLQILATLSTEDLAQSVFASTQDRYVTTVAKWLSGTALPTTHHFTLLIRALLVSPDDEAVLLRARDKVLHRARNAQAPNPAAPVPLAKTPEPATTPPAREADKAETKAGEETEAARTAEVVRRPDTWWVRKRNADRFIRKADRVIGPKGLSRLLETLSTNAKLSTKDLTVSVLGSAEDEHITTVSKWMDGKALPAKPLFTLLVQALLAWPDEETALLRAYDRVRAVEKTDGTPQAEPGLGPLWIATRLSVCLITASLWAVFTACLKADPGPPGLLLLSYFDVAGILSLLAWHETRSSSRHTERPTIDGFSSMSFFRTATIG
ncbi:hypothetical protein [Streptomyces sp. NPDC058861]|uniref:hypothetical protein n=1 Tax=Streptomyces sp. NPDC058861 TaxID=3346653 RepID=UPI0036A5CACB